MTRAPRWLAALWLSAVLLSLSTLAHGGQAQPLASDPVVEARLVSIAKDLRCLVCQNETLADSRADLAEDLRKEIRAQIRQGHTDAEIVDYLVARYGDFVRYRPPLKRSTWLLWGGPFVLLLCGLTGLITYLRRRPQAAALSEEEQQRARAMLSATE